MHISAILILIIPTALAAIGVDVSQSVSQEQFECLKDNGYKFVIVRAYRNIGSVDSNGAQTIKNARAAKMTDVSAYLFPCVPCGDAPQQIIETIEYLQDEQAPIDMLWLNIEGIWNNNTDKNIQFLDELIQQINSSAVRFGINTSRYHWTSIMNNVTKFSSDSPLWYVHHDNDQSFEDFRAFGGWKRPSMKQFIRDVKKCGVVFDKNFA